jgi:esterase/lipase
MRFIESGYKDKPSVMFIHGMGCYGEHPYKKVAEKLENEYNVIIVCLDGYDMQSTTFTSISDQAEKIANYIVENHNGKLHFLLGMSMGGFITLEMLSKYNVTADKVILDSGYLKPWSKIKAKIMSTAVAWGFSRILKDKSNFIIEYSMKKSMGYCFKKEDLCSSATKITLKNSEYSCLTFELPNLSKLKNMNIEYWYGTKERFMIEGMGILKQQLPNMEEICLGEFGHGEMMFEQPEQYINTVYKAVRK